MNNDRPTTERVIAVGNFDGVHRGHVKVLKTAVDIAEEKRMISAAMTFYPYPKDYFFGENTVLKITDEDTKRNLILQTGIDLHIREEFSSELANMTDLEFVDLLRTKYNCRAIVCGSNFRFGKKAAYGVQELISACEKANMQAVICEYEDGISSTNIRNLLTDGDMKRAAELLGRNFSVAGKVLHGRHIGTGMGFPTVNLVSDKGLILPRFGVYETLVKYDGKEYRGITNVGYAPTVSENEKTVRTETFILHENLDLYEKEISVEFLRFIRPEVKFSSLNELKKQIKKDIKSITG